MYASVVVNTDAPGLSQPFTYRIPKDLTGGMEAGACVAVPFSGRELVGWVLDLSDSPPPDVEVKDILAVVTEVPPLDNSLLSLARWVSGEYLAPLIHSLRAIVPDVMNASITARVRLLDASLISASSPNQRKLVRLLSDEGGEADLDILKAKAGLSGFPSVLRGLRKRGAAEVFHVLELPRAKPLIVRGIRLADDADSDKLTSRAPKQSEIFRDLEESGGEVRQAEVLRRTRSSSSSVKGLVDKGLAKKVDLKVRRDPFRGRDAVEKVEHVLTDAQESALDMILNGPKSETLLYGITGSGKTEVYLRAIEDVVERGGGCISLVPEISLSDYMIGLYKAHFGDRVAVLHSRLSTGERHDEWRRIEGGEARIVLGARSAVFAPVKDLGLVIVDEEHETSYKQDSSPRYSARAAAEERGRSEGARVVLGSATPSVETYYRALSGEIGLAELGQRIEGRPLPDVKVVDLREEFAAGWSSAFSGRLTDAIADRLKRGEQSILFVNRLGYASFILCRSCGFVEKCENCDVSMTYHSSGRLLRCHHCDASRPAPSVCPNCDGPRIKQFGIGTERVEEEVRKVFPEASVVRMDSDTMRRKGSYKSVLNAFREGRADILVGTQMVAKGLDIPNVTLVGIVSADTSLNMPDFRAAERTFQLVTQVSGRAGRGDSPGEVVLQSFSPEHYAIQAASRHDFKSFYADEIEHRKELLYPPFSRLVNVTVSDSIDEYAEKKCRELVVRIKDKMGKDVLEVLGPAPAPLARLKGLFRRHFVLKCGGGLSYDIQGVLRESISETSAGAGCIVDVDPISLM